MLHGELSYCACARREGAMAKEAEEIQSAWSGASVVLHK